MVVVGTFGWLLVAAGVLFARIWESEKLAVLLPLVWFLVLVLSALGIAAAMGPDVCPG
jgi:hypothetical protein